MERSIELTTAVSSQRDGRAPTTKCELCTRHWRTHQWVQYVCNGLDRGALSFHCFGTPAINGLGFSAATITYTIDKTHHHNSLFAVQISSTCLSSVLFSTNNPQIPERNLSSFLPSFLFNSFSLLLAFYPPLFPSIFPMPRNQDILARSGQRSGDLESGVDGQSAHARTTVKPTRNRAPNLYQATMVSDRSECRNPLKTVRERTKRPALGTERPASNTPDTNNASFLFPIPSPYDGRAD